MKWELVSAVIFIDIFLPTILAPRHKLLPSKCLVLGIEPFSVACLFKAWPLGVSSFVQKKPFIWKKKKKKPNKPQNTPEFLGFQLGYRWSFWWGFLFQQVKLKIEVKFVLFLHQVFCFYLIKMQGVTAVLLTCSRHAYLLCSLLNMSWHVLDCVSVHSLGLQWFLNLALLSRCPVCLNQLGLLFLATKGNWNSNFLSM